MLTGVFQLNNQHFLSNFFFPFFFFPFSPTPSAHRLWLAASLCSPCCSSFFFFSLNMAHVFIFIFNFKQNKH